MFIDISLNLRGWIMKKVTTVLSFAMLAVAFSSAAMADGHMAGKMSMDSMPPECMTAMALIEDAGFTPGMMPDELPEGLMNDLEATGTSPEDCGMMPPGGMDHGDMGPGGMDHGDMGPGGMDHGDMGPGGMDHGDMGPGGMDHGDMGPGGMDHGPEGMGPGGKQ
jgi:hypothetical protein